MTVKPIETVYAGYRFRSRLEARWAVFFDELNIKYEYEPEGYRLKSGAMYLPDFFLPEFNVFVEVKASPELDDGKAEEFALSADPDKCGGMLICYGQPADDNLRFVTAFESDDGGGGDFDTYPNDIDVRFAYIANSPYDIFGRIGIYVDYHKTGADFDFCDVSTDFSLRLKDKSACFDYCKIVDAKNAAKRARFEHGEKPERGGMWT